MQKKSKTIFTAVVTVLFVLSVSYFALLAPTTAWFYEQDYTTANYQFEFGNFNMTEQEHSQVSQTTVPLRAATRFADTGEVLFDEVVHVVKVDVANTGAVKGQVAVSVSKNGDNSPDLPSWLKWYVCESSSASEIAEASVTNSINQTKGNFKNRIEAMLTTAGVTTQNYNTFASDADYETYNATAITALNANNAQPIAVDAGASKIVYVVFWAEYGMLAGENVGTEQNSVRFDAATDAVTLGDYPVAIEFTASPYTGATQNISVTNTMETAYNVLIYLNGSETPYKQSPANQFSGNIAVAAGATVNIPQPVGTSFKLVLSTNTGAAHLVNTNDTGTISGQYDHIVTDTVSTHGNAYSIVATQASQGD
ncbi:MAG: hypothetical protein IJT41_13300 [Clostridia bacterium]|nr:hypothetical protein [Clostridia bacterium]